MTTPVRISIDIEHVVIVHLDDSNCEIGALRRIEIGGMFIELVADKRDDQDRLVWKQLR